jgi:hypothetical protein
MHIFNNSSWDSNYTKNASRGIFSVTSYALQLKGLANGHIARSINMSKEELSLIKTRA